MVFLEEGKGGSSDKGSLKFGQKRLQKIFFFLLLVFFYFLQMERKMVPPFLKKIFFVETELQL